MSAFLLSLTRVTPGWGCIVNCVYGASRGGSLDTERNAAMQFDAERVHDPDPAIIEQAMRAVYGKAIWRGVGSSVR